MSKAVMISIQPKWCELIASGKKTVEVRKTKPSINIPFKVYIYCTKNGEALYFPDDIFGTIDIRGKVIGEFVCDEILEYEMEGYDKNENVYQGINRLAYDEEWDESIEYTEVSNAMTEEEMECSYLFSQSQLTFAEIGEYVCGGKEFNFYKFYGWHISDLVIYGEPKELSEFHKLGALSYDDWLYGIYNGKDKCNYEDYKMRFILRRPPQSWCYVEELR